MIYDIWCMTYICFTHDINGLESVDISWLIVLNTFIDRLDGWHIDRWIDKTVAFSKPVQSSAQQYRAEQHNTLCCRAKHIKPVRCSAVEFKPVRNGAVKCRVRSSAVQHKLQQTSAWRSRTEQSKLHSSTAQYFRVKPISAEQYGGLQSKTQCRAGQSSVLCIVQQNKLKKVQHRSTEQSKSIQDWAVQYSTGQDSTVQYSTVHCL